MRCYNHVMRKGHKYSPQKKKRLLGHLEPIDIKFLWFLVTFAVCLASQKTEQNESSQNNPEYYKDYWSLLYVKTTFWGFAWAFAGSVSSVWKAKAIEFLIDYIRKNPKYFARKFYKKNVSFEVDLLEEHYFVNVTFPPSITYVHT